MSCNVLGITAWFHDSTAALLIDGKLVAFAEEERFIRKKHTSEYPYHAINYCLDEGNITIDDLDYVVFYDNPWMLIKNNILHVIKYLPKSLNLARKNTTIEPVFKRYGYLLKIKSIIQERHGSNGSFKVIMLPHYKTHQGAAFLCSPFDDAAIITMDMSVSGLTHTVAQGKGSKIDTITSNHFPHGWGILYSLFTQFVGFNYFDEYKVMGMAAYGEPNYIDLIENNLYMFNDETGVFKLDLSYFAFQHYGMLRIWSDKFVELFGKPRVRGSELAQRDYDMAASAQLATERFGIRLAKLARKITGSENLCLAGGVIQNVLMNQKIMEAGIYKQVFIQPLASDVGCSLGAALYHYHCTMGQKRSFVLDHLYWGPSYRDQYETALKENNLVYEHHKEPAPIIAKAIADGKIVGFFNGRMEAGPRALGARSIIADPRSGDMKEILNLRVKHREHFRPFAPSCIEEKFDDVFEHVQGCRSYGYMVTTANVHDNMHDKLPTITHNDHTSRPQSVSRFTNPLFWKIINEFYRLTGVPLVVNTSFNDNEPIVCTPQDAINCFKKTKIDILALENYLVYREGNSSLPFHT